MNRSALVMVTALVAGCGTQTVDPCAGVAGTCLSLQVDPSPGIAAVSDLLIQVVGYPDKHPANVGHVLQLPVAVGLAFDTVNTDTTINLTVTGYLPTGVIGDAHAHPTLLAGRHQTIHVQLSKSGGDFGTVDLASEDLAATDAPVISNEDLVRAADLVSVDLSGADLARLPDMTTPRDMVFVPSLVPSCQGLTASCGSGVDDSCCTSPVVSGGSFYRGYDVAADGTYNNMSYPATVSDFRLDKYEVTVGRFRKFINAGMGTQASPPPAGAGANPYLANSGWDPILNASLAPSPAALLAAVKCNATYQTWSDTAGSNEDEPINCISWLEAFAFCAWDGGFLPTEAEWNYAASGGSEQRAYPWSSPPPSLTDDCSYANFNINNPSGTYCVNGTVGSANKVGSESPKGDGRWGQSDLAGNVWEWNLDWSGAYPSPCADCSALTAATYRVIRGGSFNYLQSMMRSAYRDDGTPTNRSSKLGARCARAK